MEDSMITLGRPQPPAPAAPPAEPPQNAGNPPAEPPAHPANPPAAPPTAPAAAPSDEWKFDVGNFSKWAGMEFKSEDEVKSSLKSLSKYKDYDNVVKDRDELKTKYEEIQSQLDPRSHFISDDEFRRQQILRKYPESDPYVMTKVLALDEKKAHDVDILIAGEMLKGIDEVSSKALVYDRFSLPDDLKDLDTLTQAKLKSEAIGVRKQIGELKNVELPKKVDFEAERQSKALQAQQAAERLKTDATPFVEKILAELKEVSLPIEVEEGKVENALSFEVTDQFRKDFKDNLLSLFTNGTLKLDEAGIKAALDYAAGTYMNLRLPQMISKLKKDLNAQFEDAKHAALHNDKPLTDQQPPPNNANKDTFLSALEASVVQQSSRGVKL